MKAATRVILLLKDGADDGGFASSISNALQPNPNSNLRRLEESFELSLEKYGIKDHKASGNMIHFLNSNGVSEVSVLLLEHTEPPLLACALNEVLVSFLGGTSSDIPNLVVPFLVEASKLKLENKNAISSYEVSLYRLEFGQLHNLTHALASKIQKAPQSLRIYHEQLACLLHLVRVLDIPALVLVGQHTRHSYSNNLEQYPEVIYGIGELLAEYSSLCFLRERVVWNPPKSSKASKEPWHALYG
ncbi:uncharacterized protein [Coffea arabica]|uniref:Uncharacterized protein isoform X1 n=1 Tax=Coffea arabica TaxID=13443 RepID=A0A6P6SGP9_COFAR|nr:uncharacterized protein LOC113691004 isoform X1 [Coffea arabica]